MKSSRFAGSSLSTFSASARRALLLVSTALALSAPACWQTTLMGRCEKGASLSDPCGDASPSFHSSRLAPAPSSSEPRTILRSR